MSIDIQVHRLAEAIVSVCDLSDVLREPDESRPASYTPAAAIGQARALALRIIEALGGTDRLAAPSPESRSSVTMTVGAKGEMRFEVKAYTGSPIGPAMVEASDAFDQLMGRSYETNGTAEKREVLACTAASE